MQCMHVINLFSVSHMLSGLKIVPAMLNSIILYRCKQSADTAQTHAN